MEADLARYYPGTFLTDLWRPGGTLTWRRLRNLVHWLPEDANVWRVLGQARPTLAEDAALGLWEMHAERPHPARPGPVYDPAPKKGKKPAGRTGADLAARLAAHRERYKDRMPQPKT